MLIAKKIFNKNFHKILGILLVLMLLQSCKVYQKSTNLEQASQSEEKGFVKVTMANGDEYIYESIELKEKNYYGVKTVNGEITKTALLKEDVLKVERQNKKSSGFFSVAGIVIGAASIVLGVLMFGG
ncbi:MAG: hypothetical protein A3F91_13125 [Flavobacteria bacterium RIFCSPLOWO2_12_FULL_35_11]|nr:MAG: hypothetical protein A3F91_13125 [Flavobacteria bacterium RIFCSPLOWO2_12_FULL_35_11]